MAAARGYDGLRPGIDKPELAWQATRFAGRIGFTGTADLDWRLDPPDGRYKLLDFNRRMGAPFRLFETTAGVDVVRAPCICTSRGAPFPRASVATAPGGPPGGHHREPRREAPPGQAPARRDAPPRQAPTEHASPPGREAPQRQGEERQ
ncbi:hypothetical protein JCM4914_41740 [Streptomyces platensis subsp. malvinus]